MLDAEAEGDLGASRTTLTQDCRPARNAKAQTTRAGTKRNTRSYVTKSSRNRGKFWKRGAGCFRIRFAPPRKKFKRRKSGDRGGGEPDGQIPCYSAVQCGYRLD